MKVAPATEGLGAFRGKTNRHATLKFIALKFETMPPPAYHVGTATVIESLLKRKWSVTILRHLVSGITDPVEISKCEAELSPAAVNERLSKMLRYGLVSRYRRLSRPKTVRYRALTRSYQILEVLNLIDRLDQSQSNPALPPPKDPPPPVQAVAAQPPKKRKAKSG